jgi:phosphate/sulfate permease
MSLYIDFSENNNKPERPDRTAHDANILSRRAADSQSSRVALEKKARDDSNNPVQQKLRNATRNRTILFCAFLALAFIGNVYWEWDVSKEIYEIWFPTLPWLPFLVCVAVAFYASVCLGETSNHFSILSMNDKEDKTNDDSTDRAVAKLYDISKKRNMAFNWVIHPLMGFIIGFLFLSGIYHASSLRVRLMESAGELPSNDFHVFIPVILYGLEILLGIPTFFLIVWLINWISTRMQIKKLTQARDQELVLRGSAIRKYTDYLSDLDFYNDWARHNGRPSRPLIPPNSELRRLLVDEFGYDPTERTRHDSPTTNDDDTHNQDENSQDETNDVPQSAHEEPVSDPVSNPNEVDRVNDLINLIDEQINKANKNI